MDDGQVIPCLNESWTFAGAKPMEWISGLCAALLFQEAFMESAARGMPLIMMVVVGTTMGLATLRKAYPDEERGVRNQLMTLLGLAPPGIPRPAALQPLWSGAPMQELPEASLYRRLGLGDLFEKEEEEDAHDQGEFRWQ